MKNVGSKIKHVRESKNLTIEEIAERTHLTVEQLSLIEEQSVSPSISPLMKIAQAIGVRLGTFLDGKENENPIISRHQELSKSKALSSDGSMRNDMNFYYLSSNKNDRHMEPLIIELDDSKSDSIDYSSHEGEEFLYVLDGSLEICYGTETYHLQTGDSIYYDSIVKHHIHAVKGERAKILLIIYLPA